MKAIVKLGENHYRYTDENFSILQSYDVIVVKIVGKTVYLDEKYYKFSSTTIMYRNNFLGETTKEIERKIQIGDYELINLN